MAKQAEERTKKAKEQEDKQFSKVYDTKGQDKYEIRLGHVQKALSKSGMMKMMIYLLTAIIATLMIVGGIFYYSKKKRSSADEETAPL